ncbi:MAG: biotin/lipoyl-binding protein, partial [Anaerolineae bacterium]|nr:biotin/lipoyl-binding protein [Anaerolineae bacterium]
MQRIKSFFVFIKTRLATTVRQPINFRLLINRPWKIGLFCLLILLFLGGMAYAGYLSSLPEQRVTEEKPNTVPVEYGDVARSVNAPGQLVGANQVQLSMQVEGRLKQVYVKPGQKVNKGQLLASLSERSRYAAAAGEAEALFQQAQQELDDLINAAPEATAKARLAYVEAQKAFEETQKKRQAMNYPRASQAEINLAQADYYDAITAFEFARDSYDDAAGRSDTDPARIAALRSLSAAGKQRDQALANYNWMKSGYSAYEIEQADANLAKAAAELDKSRIAWERVQDGPDVVLLSLAQSKLVDARVKAETARGAAEHVDLYAPFEGVVLEVNGKAGDPVSATTHLISLTDPTAYE